ncbi:MAG: hypothetical protein K2X48_01725, partial [Chitinophagaceae bacterium]|nr:hypothetical protein [Chitinophagaceae bacterium]
FGLTVPVRWPVQDFNFKEQWHAWRTTKKVRQNLTFYTRARNPASLRDTSLSMTDTKKLSIKTKNF